MKTIYFVENNQKKRKKEHTHLGSHKGCEFIIQLLKWLLIIISEKRNWLSIEWMYNKKLKLSFWSCGNDDDDDENNDNNYANKRNSLNLTFIYLLNRSSWRHVAMVLYYVFVIDFILTTKNKLLNNFNGILLECILNMLPNITLTPSWCFP